MATMAEPGPETTDRPERRQHWLKKYLPKTLFGRALAIILTPLILMQAITTFVFYDRHWDTMVRRLASSLAGDIALVVAEVEEDASLSSVAKVDRLSREHLDLVVTYRAGAILENRGSAPIFDPGFSELAKALGERVRRPFVIDTEAVERHLAIAVQLPDGVLEVLAHQKRIYSSTTYIFVMWMFGSSLVLFAVAMIFMRNQIRPIRRLALAARAFGLGRDVRNFKPEGAREVRQAAEAFNQMRDRIRRQIAQRTDMLSGVSHDLRTPLTRMKLQLAMLGDSRDIRELREDVLEMERMVEGYLAFARGEGTERATPTDLKNLVADLVIGERRAGKPIELDLPDGPSQVFELKPQSLKRALANLIANARRHAAHIRVTLQIGEEIGEIFVDDDGPGIPEAERENVFRPFYRGEPSRNPETGGTGLGLTIARDIVHGHGGDLTLEESPMGGLRARIRLPL